MYNDETDIDDSDYRGSVIPPGEARFALFLAQFPQVSEYDCGLQLDQLTVSALNEIAKRTGSTVGEIGKKAVYLYARMYFQREGEFI